MGARSGRSQAIVIFALTAAVAAVALVAGVRRLAPRRAEPRTDFAELAVTAARAGKAYETRHADFRDLRPDSLAGVLPPGVGMRVSGDRDSATIVILHDGRARCSIRLRRGEPLDRPSCSSR